MIEFEEQTMDTEPKGETVGGPDPRWDYKPLDTLYINGILECSFIGWADSIKRVQPWMRRAVVKTLTGGGQSGLIELTAQELSIEFDADAAVKFVGKKLFEHSDISRETKLNIANITRALREMVPER